VVEIAIPAAKTRPGVETPGGRKPLLLAAREGDRGPPRVSCSRAFMLYPTETGWGRGATLSTTRRWAGRGRAAHGLEAAMVSTGWLTKPEETSASSRAPPNIGPAPTIYNDRMARSAAGRRGVWDDLARVNIYSTVVSRAGPGSRHSRCWLQNPDLRYRQRPRRPTGLILEHPEARIARFAEGTRLSRPHPQQTPVPMSATSVRDRAQSWSAVGRQHDGTR